MAKYTLGKPTFNVDEPSSLVHQSASPNALIYDISKFPVVPTNQIILSINLQMGKTIYGAKMKFTNNKRFHLELAFFSKEALEVWATKPIILLGKNIMPIVAHSGRKSFFSISLSGVSLCDKQEVMNKLLDIFGKLEKISTIKPKLWEGTSICSDNWLLTYDTTDMKDLSTITANIPRLVTIFGDRVFVT